MTTRRMLINAAQTEEIRVAITEGQKLFDLDIEPIHRAQQKANVYKAKIARIEPSLNAVFVDYGATRHGFLPIKEITAEYLSKPIETAGDVKEALKEGQELIIQIEKEERGTKGAAVTTYITLAGCYLVLMPSNPSAGGISRRIGGDERQQLKESLNALNMPDGMGVIIRTAGVGRSSVELQWDLDSLLKLWNAITTEMRKRPAPFLIYQESDVVLRSIRDYMRQNINEIVVDEPRVYQRVLQHVEQLRPEFVDRVKLYEEDIPLLHKYRVENQIETAYQRNIHLNSGGSIVIDHTEALTSIDINSAKATKGKDIEETAYQTNLEAAGEIARQLRIRDLGGLIVIDFIDMTNNDNQREVEEHLQKALRADRARVQTQRISRFGLLEMSRQRLRPSLNDATSIVCPRCHGQGVIRSVRSIGISIIRMIQNEIINSNTKKIEVQLPTDVATFLLNEQRCLLDEMEHKHKIRVLIIPNPHIQTPHYEFKTSRHESQGKESHECITEAPGTENYQYSEDLAVSTTPAIKSLDIEKAPVAKKSSFWSSLGQFCSSLFSMEGVTADAANTVPAQPDRKSTTSHRKPYASGNSQSGRRQQKGDATQSQQQRSPQQRPPNRRQQRVTGQGQASQQTRTRQTTNTKSQNVATDYNRQKNKPVPTMKTDNVQQSRLKSAGNLPVKTDNIPAKVDNAPIKIDVPVVDKPAFVYRPTHPDMLQSTIVTRDTAPAELSHDVSEKATKLTAQALKTHMKKVAERHGDASLVESTKKSSSEPKLVCQVTEVNTPTG